MRRAAISIATVAGFVAVLGWTAPRAEAAEPTSQLAQKYAPVLHLVAQQAPCGHGEPYEPVNVNVVLGNDEVALRGPWRGSGIVEVAPTAQQLSAGLFGYNLDFPGNPLSAGCSYEEWSRRISAGAAPTTYAHVVGDPAHPGQLALQYWFFYVFNDFNNKHEGDWEMIQLDFRADDAAQALTTSPEEIGYSQHEGAERAHWGDSKLELVGGTHPVVYPATGSHANYFRPALFLGRSAAQGVGCDDTSGPSREIRPKVEWTPTEPAAYLASFPWLGYDGRWGELQPGFYNGPTGPNTKSQWTAPITWADTTWRDTAYAVPAGSSFGHGTTDFFCGAVAAGSNLLTRFVNDPGPVILVLTALALLLIWLAARTQWTMSTPFRLRRRRPWGSLLTSAWRMYRARPALYLGIGILFIPLGLVISGVQYLIFRVGSLAPLVDTAGATNAFVAGLALALGVLFTVLGLTIVQAVTALAMVELDEDRSVKPRAAYRLVRRRIWPLVGALLRAALVIAVLDLTVVGIPLGAWLTVRWSLLAQVIALEEEPSRHALRRSGELVTGHWWRVASLTLLVTGPLLLLGPILGTLLLLLTSASFNVVNIAAALAYTVTLPFVAIATTYLYMDLLVRERLAPNRSEPVATLPAEI